MELDEVYSKDRDNEILRELKRTGWFDVTIAGFDGEGDTSEESLTNAKTKLRKYLEDNNYQYAIRPSVRTTKNEAGFSTCLEATLFRIVE